MSMALYWGLTALVSIFHIFVHAASSPATCEESYSSGSSLSLGTGKGNVSDTFVV